MNWKKTRKILRTIWIVAGLSFFAWMAISMNAKGFQDEILESDSLVQVEMLDDYTSFTPTSPHQKIVISIREHWLIPMPTHLFAGRLLRMDIK